MEYVIGDIPKCNNDKCVHYSECSLVTGRYNKFEPTTGTDSTCVYCINFIDKTGGIKFVTLLKEKTKKKVKSCMNCKNLIDFPHIHCSLGCKIVNTTINNKFTTRPKDFDNCLKRRKE